MKAPRPRRRADATTQIRASCAMPSLLNLTPPHPTGSSAETATTNGPVGSARSSLVSYRIARSSSDSLAGRLQYRVTISVQTARSTQRASGDVGAVGTMRRRELPGWHDSTTHSSHDIRRHVVDSWRLARTGTVRGQQYRATLAHLLRLLARRARRLGYVGPPRNAVRRSRREAATS